MSPLSHLLSPFSLSLLLFHGRKLHIPGLGLAYLLELLSTHKLWCTHTLPWYLPMITRMYLMGFHSLLALLDHILFVLLLAWGTNGQLVVLTHSQLSWLETTFSGIDSRSCQEHILQCKGLKPHPYTQDSGDPRSSSYTF